MSFTFIDQINAHNLLNPNNTIQEEEQQDSHLLSSEDFTRNCLVSSAGSGIDIRGNSMSSDILVALLDRPNEMKQLAVHNAQFYEAIENFITVTQGNFAWQRFQDIVYKSRDKLSDRAWITQISLFLGANPAFLSKFKQSVGYQDDNELHEASSTTFVTPPPPPSHKSTSTSSMSSSSGRRRSRRLSSMSLGDILDFNNTDNVDSILDEEVTDGMFSNEDQVHQGSGRRRRASYHSIQSEPHPNFVDSKIDEVDEAEIEIEDGRRRLHDVNSEGEESDHLADLLDNSSDDDDEEQGQHNNSGYLSTRNKRYSGVGGLNLIRLREYPDFQANLPQSYPKFFRKAKQLLSLAPSSRHFTATIRRNSILEDDMPPSPVTELDEPRFQTCSEETDEEDADGNLAYLICCTRRQQPDDVAWLNGVMDALAGWPELIDGLNDIVNESLLVN